MLGVPANYGHPASTERVRRAKAAPFRGALYPKGKQIAHLVAA